jgi:hypothetical protein
MEYKKIIMNGIHECIKSYFVNGCRSSKKSDLLNNMIVKCIMNFFENKNIDKSEYHIHTEYVIPSKNFSGIKKCDVVLVYRDNYHIFPLKFIMSSYIKNRNNYFENLTGEVSHIRWANKDYYNE